MGTGPHGPIGRTCSPSQVSSPEPRKALPGPGPGEAPEALVCLALGRAVQNVHWNVLEITRWRGSGETLGQSSGSPYSEGGRGDTGPGLTQSEGKEDT